MLNKNLEMHLKKSRLKFNLYKVVQEAYQLSFFFYLKKSFFDLEIDISAIKIRKIFNELI